MLRHQEVIESYAVIFPPEHPYLKIGETMLYEWHEDFRMMKQAIIQLEIGRPETALEYLKKRVNQFQDEKETSAEK